MACVNDKNPTLIKLVEETGLPKEYVVGLINLWQKKEKEKRSTEESLIDEYPNKTQLLELKQRLEIKENNTSKSISTKPKEEELNKLHLVFSPRVRRDRVEFLTQQFKAIVGQLKQRDLKNVDDALINAIGEARVALLERKRNITGRNVALVHNPEKIFKIIENRLQSYLNLTEEEQINERTLQFNILNRNATVSEEEKTDIILKKTKHFQEEYRKILDFFPELVQEAAVAIKQNYGISYNVETKKSKETSLPSGTIEGEDIIDNFNNIDKKEEMGRESWALKTREVSMHETVSTEMKDYLSSIKKRNINGQIEMTDLDSPRYLDSSYTFATILDICGNVIEAKDIIPQLSKNVSTKPWLQGIIKNLEKNPELITAFYNAFNSDKDLMWVQKNSFDKKKNLNITKTIPVNLTLGVNHLFDSWRDNYFGGVVLSNNSIYDNNSNLDINKANENVNTILNIKKVINNTPTKERATFLSLEGNKKYLDTTIDLLRAVGINNDTEILEKLFLDSVNQTGLLNNVLDSLFIIFKGVGDNKVKERGELISEFKAAYLNLAKNISKTSELMFEQSFTEAGKSYYAHSTPTYFGTLIKELQGVHEDNGRYNEFIENEYKKYNFYYKDGTYLNHWVDLLANNPEIRKEFEKKTLLNIDKAEYADWDDLDITKSMIAEYLSIPDSRGNTQFAYYKIPIRSDSGNEDYIKFVKYNNDGYQETILHHLTKVIIQEYNRIQDVRSRKVEALNNPNFKPIKHYDKNGDKFLFIPELNDVRIEGMDFRRFLALQKNIGDSNKAISVTKEILRGIMNTKVENQLKQAENIGLFELKTYTENELNQLKKANLNPALLNMPFTSRNIAEKVFTEFVWNNTLAQSQIIQIFGGDLAFYDGITGFQKRFKQISSPATKLNTEAIYKGIKVGKENENAIYIQDEEVISQGLDFIYSIHKKSHDEGEISDYELADKLSKFGYSNYTIEDDKGKKIKAVKVGSIIKKSSTINVTDGQSFRTLPSVRSMAIMLNDWTKEQEDAYQNIINSHESVKNGGPVSWSIADINVLWQSIKPFYYGQIDLNTKNGLLKTPVQHKNSEAVLLSIYSFIGGETSRSPKLKSLNKFMIDNNIDVVHFNSAIKVGEQGAIKLSSNNSEQGTYDELDAAVYGSQEINNGLVGTARNFIPNVVRKVPIKYYGKQNVIPEKELDKGAVIGTQAKKLGVSDIFATLSKEEEATMSREELIEKGYYIEINGKEYTRKELLEHYGELFVENYLESYFGTTDSKGDTLKAGIEEVFNNLPEYLMESIIDNPRYGSEMISAIMSEIPYYEGNNSESIQMLVTSLIKSRINKQKIKGGPLVQVTGWGMTEDLHVIFKNKEGVILKKGDIEKYFKNEHKRFPTEEEYTNYISNSKKAGELSVAYLEAYMPAYSKKMFLPFIKEGTNELDINKMPDELKKIIGYRIPTENKYSMLPIYIKGFLPQNMGAAIILPAEVTTIMGADFDIDKLNMMYPEFKTNVSLNKDRVKNYFLSNSKFKDWGIDNINQTINNINKINKGDAAPFDKGTPQRYIYDVVQQNKTVFYDTSFEKVTYNAKKTPEQNGLAARNNEVLDILWSVLTHPDTASKLLTPGGFDALDKEAQIITIIKNMSKNQHNELLKTDASFLKVLNQTDLNELSKIAEKVRPTLDPLSMFTQVELHLRNMAGAKLIGVSANHNSHHALMQQTNLGLSTSGQFKINGFIAKSLNNAVIVRDINGKEIKLLVSNSTSGYTAASVDNAKKPVLGDLNQNTFTAHPALLMLRAGFTEQEMALVLNQPIVLEMTKTYFKNVKKGMSKHNAVQTVLKSYVENSNFTTKDNLEYNITTNYDSETLATDILPFTVKDRGYYNRQVQVGLLFQRILNSSMPLAKLVAIKPDTTDGGANGTIANIRSLLTQVEESFSDKEDSPLTGVDYIKLNLKFTNKEDARKEFNTALIPWYQAVYSLGLEQSRQLLSKYFPHFNDAFEYVVKGVIKKSTKNTLNTKTMKSLYNQLFVYILSNNQFFGGGTMYGNPDDKYYQLQQKRKAFIQSYPDIFLNTIKGDKDLNDIDFLKRFVPVSATKNNKFKSLKFKNVGGSNIIIKEGYIIDWESLLSLDNKTANEMALDIARYEYYNNGFGYGHSSSAHLTPTSVKLKIPGYIEDLKEIMKGTYTGENDSKYASFIDMFYYNNLKNSDLVAESTFTGSIQKTINIPLDTDWGITKRKGSKTLGIEPEYFEYIKIKTEDDFSYFRRSGTYDDSVTYTQIEPLNLEYDFNNVAENMTSIYSGTMKEESNEDAADSTENDGIITGKSVQTENKRVSTKEFSGDLNNKDYNQEIICT